MTGKVTEIDFHKQNRNQPNSYNHLIQNSTDHKTVILVPPHNFRLYRHSLTIGPAGGRLGARFFIASIIKTPMNRLSAYPITTNWLEA